MAEHTKLPWKINKYDKREISDVTGEGVLQTEPMYGDNLSEKFGEAEANAEFIVRACNAHETLVKLIERIPAVTTLDPWTRKEIIDALALARGEQP